VRISRAAFRSAEPARRHRSSTLLITPSQLPGDPMCARIRIIGRGAGWCLRTIIVALLAAVAGCDRKPQWRGVRTDAVYARPAPNPDASPGSNVSARDSQGAGVPGTWHQDSCTSRVTSSCGGRLALRRGVAPVPETLQDDVSAGAYRSYSPSGPMFNRSDICIPKPPMGPGCLRPPTLSGHGPPRAMTGRESLVAGPARTAEHSRRGAKPRECHVPFSMSPPTHRRVDPGMIGARIERPGLRARVASRQGREVGPARAHHCFFSTFVVKLEAMALLIVSTIVMV
jgi:hypothetical protein